MRSSSQRATDHLHIAQIYLTRLIVSVAVGFDRVMSTVVTGLLINPLADTDACGITLGPGLNAFVLHARVGQRRGISFWYDTESCHVNFKRGLALGLFR